MAKAVFVTKVNPAYDDIPESQYQFPKMYLGRAREVVGSQIMYYEPRKGGGRGAYLAVAKVSRIDEDPHNPGLCYARISDYIEFPNPVPFRVGEYYFESALRTSDGRPNAGMSQQTCAMTSLRLVNGGGVSEVEAAHIRPLKYDGPDSPRNGIAPSQTVHWMFDRGLLSIEDDGRILVAKKQVPQRVQHMLNADGHLSQPEQPFWQPHPQFLRYHRENVYVG